MNIRIVISDELSYGMDDSEPIVQKLMLLQVL